MTTQEVANRLVELCREGKHAQVVKDLYAPNIVSIEPEGAPNRIVQGLEAIIAKGEQFDSRIEKVNSSFISDPIVAENFFSCSMLMNVQMKGVPVAVDMHEVCVYTVNDGKIVQEQFFYTPQPQAV
ncbi:MAG: nuclear transport factor 2 family protein [Saprospiraceae bacterium]|nr:nuclear transport factor 2 family protein [Saprospiraceae bacterium]